MTSFTRPNTISHIRHVDLLSSHSDVGQSNRALFRLVTVLSLGRPPFYPAAIWQLNWFGGVDRVSFKTNGSNEFDCKISCGRGVHVEAGSSDGGIIYLLRPSQGSPPSLQPQTSSDLLIILSLRIRERASELLFCLNDANYD